MKTRTLLSIAALALAATPVWAAGGGHGEHHGVPWATLFFSTVNIVIFLVLMSRTLVPALRRMAQERHDRIVAELGEAAAVRAEAQALKEEWERRLAALDGTLAQMRTDAEADAKRERDRILAAAEATAARIRRDAQQAAESELRQLKAQLRGELTQQAIRLAENTVRAQWTPADQQRFVGEFLQQVQP